jgi:hypothetical protein
MQGGPIGQSFVATSSIGSWPVAYAIVGATSSTNLFFSNCTVGICNQGVGNNILPTGTAITFYPSAFITGSSNGSSGTALLGTNSVPFTLGDSLIGAPSSEFEQVGMHIVIGQSTPIDFSQPSYGLQIDDSGPVSLGTDIFVANNASYSDPTAYMIQGTGNYGSYIYAAQRPSNAIPASALLFVEGGNTGLYFLWRDDANGNPLEAGNISFTPLTDTINLQAANVTIDGVAFGTGAFSPAGITQLTGDVIAGPGSGSVGSVVAAVHALTGTINGVSIGLITPEAIAGTSVTVNGGANTVYVCSGGSFDGLLSTSSAACTGGTGTVTSLHID